MTLFEYLSVAVSIVLSLGLVRLITGLRAILESSEKHWLPLTWMVILIGLCLAHWWTSWSFRGADWTYVKFVLVLAGPALLYYTATVLVPDDVKSVPDWSAFFFSKRKELYAGVLLYMVLSIFDGFVVLNAPLFVAPRLVQLAAIVLAMIGIASGKPALHAAITVLFGILFLVTALTLIATPDATAR